MDLEGIGEMFKEGRRGVNPWDFGSCSYGNFSFFLQSCRKYKSCTNKGFHAHHPRDCLFYLRDWPVERLQKMLRDKKIEFDTEAPEAQVNAARQADQEGGAVAGAAGEEAKVGGAVAGAAGEEAKVGGAVAGAAGEEAKVGGAEGQLVLQCRVMLQKEVGTGRVDEECGEECKQGHGGLCE